MAKRPGVAHQAEALLRAGQAGKARALLEAAVRRAPGDVILGSLLAQALAATGEGERAIYQLERLVSLAPRDHRFRAAWAERLLFAGRGEEADRAAAGMVSLGPAAAMSAAALASNFLSEGRHRMALDLASWARETAGDATPEGAKIGGIHAATLIFAGDHAAGEAALRATAAARATHPDLQRDTLLLMLYCPGFAPLEVFEAHRRYGALMAKAVPSAGAAARPAASDPGAVLRGERPLRVGYISQDFRNRSAGHFIEGIVAHHDPRAVEAWCYSHRLKADELTERVRSHAAGFREIQRLSDREAAAAMRADGIDLAVDLTGHTGLNRVGVMAYRPAPVGATYMGYAATTGLACVDFRLVDGLTDPEAGGEGGLDGGAGADALATERLVRLDPCFLCYTPPPHAPEVAPCPSEGAGDGADSGGVTFASFNTFAKVTDAALGAWARILNAVPNSRLLVKNAGLKDAWLAAGFRERFERAGGDPSRVETMGETPTAAEHMGLYSRVDIGLDTFPYNGTTTTLEAAWMGVPVVTVAGDSHVSRVGVSLLTNLGLADLIGADLNGYVDAAVSLAGDAARRRALRASLRETVRERLCDFGSFVPRLEAAYREMWRQAVGASG